MSALALVLALVNTVVLLVFLLQPSFSAPPDSPETPSLASPSVEGVTPTAQVAAGVHHPSAEALDAANKVRLTRLQRETWTPFEGSL